MVISESNIDDMKYEVEQSIEEFGLIKTLKKYRFPFKLANIMFQLTRPFTNEECNQILYYYLFEKKVLSKIIPISSILFITGLVFGIVTMVYFGLSFFSQL